MLKVAVGHSNDPESAEAIAEVLQQCIEGLGDMVPKAGMAFMNIDLDHALILQRIQDQFPGLLLIGGTTDGEMSSVLGYDRTSLVLILLAGDAIVVSVGLGHQVSQNPQAAVQQAVDQARASLEEDPKFCITFPEGLGADGVAIVRSLNQALGEEIPIFGGTTGDCWQFQQTLQFFQTEVLTDALPLMLIAGPVLFSHGVAHGRSPIGKQGVVTKAVGNMIYEIDQAPALEFFNRFLGGLEPSTENPLAVFDPETNAFYIRAPGNYDPKTGTVQMLAEVPQGATVQMTMNSRDEILEAAKTSLEQALHRYAGSQPQAALFFSCGGRRQILGSRTQEEYQLIKTYLTTDLPSCGFYTYGEIAPFQAGEPSRFHNETFITLLLGT